MVFGVRVVWVIWVCGLVVYLCLSDSGCGLVVDWLLWVCFVCCLVGTYRLFGLGCSGLR